MLALGSMVAPSPIYTSFSMLLPVYTTVAPSAIVSVPVPAISSFIVPPVRVKLLLLVMALVITSPSALAVNAPVRVRSFWVMLFPSVRVVVPLIVVAPSPVMSFARVPPVMSSAPLLATSAPMFAAVAVSFAPVIMVAVVVPITAPSVVAFLEGVFAYFFQSVAQLDASQVVASLENALGK